MRSLSVARGPSSKLNRKEHELVLIEARPYAIWLIAGARLVTEKGCHPGLERIFVSCDRLFHHGNGSMKRGKVVSIHPYPGHTYTDTLSPQNFLTDQNRFSGPVKRTPAKHRLDIQRSGFELALTWGSREDATYAAVRIAFLDLGCR